MRRKREEDKKLGSSFRKIRFDYQLSIPCFISFIRGRLLFMEAISVPVHIIPIPSRNPSATRGREGEEIKKKEKERRDHVFHSPVA